MSVAEIAPPLASASAIDMRGVAHSFQGKPALSSVSFQVQAKSLHGFVGPNGAGKTTSLKLICTLLKPVVGSVKVFGYDVATDVREVRKRIGFMPDHFSMYRQMTVFEYLDFFAAAYGLNLRQRDQVIGDVLALTDMSGRKDDLIQGLSRGMQQRVGLARVLVNDPQLLLLDEPASGLDPRARIELMEILRALRQMGKTIFISSHILSELAELCDSVTIIDRGEIKYSGSMDGLLIRSDAPPAYKVLVGNDAEDTPQLLAGLPGVTQVERIEGIKPEYRLTYDPAVSQSNDILRYLIGANITVLAFNEDRKQLNEAFMDLTTKGVR